MRQAIASLGFLAVVAGASLADAGAAEDRLTDDFIRFCGDTRGEAERALQRADADGWSNVPSGLTAPSFGLPVHWVARQGRWTEGQGVRRALLVGTTSDPDGKETLICSVIEMIPPGVHEDFAAMSGALQGWAGAAPLRSDRGFAAFAYRQSGGSRTPLPTSEDPLSNGAPRSAPGVASVTVSELLGGTSYIVSYQRSAR